MAFSLPSSLLRVRFLLLWVASLSFLMILLPLQDATSRQAIAQEEMSQSEALWMAALPTLLQSTSSIAYANVIAAQSRWDEQHQIIVTDYTISIGEPLLCAERSVGMLADCRDVAAWRHARGQQLTIETEGGFLANEGLGLWASHTPALAVGAELLLLLREEEGAVKISGDDWGIYTLVANSIQNDAADMAMPIAQFLQMLQGALKENGAQIENLAAVASSLVEYRDVHQALRPLAATVQGRDSDTEPPRWLTAGLELEVKVNLNSGQLDEISKKSGDFYMAIRGAMQTWSIVESSDFTLFYSGETSATTTSYNGDNEIVFVNKGHNKALGQAQIWYAPGGVILEVDIWLNDDYQFSVDGTPTVNEVDLESIVLHEIGHWAPLQHATNPAAVMYSVLASMETKRKLHADDIDAITQLYPCDLPPCIDDIYLTPIATPTPKLIPTATETLVPMTATPTFIPTRIITETVNLYIPLVSR